MRSTLYTTHAHVWEGCIDWMCMLSPCILTSDTWEQKGTWPSNVTSHVCHVAKYSHSPNSNNIMLLILQYAQQNYFMFNPAVVNCLLVWYSYLACNMVTPNWKQTVNYDGFFTKCFLVLHSQFYQRYMPVWNLNLKFRKYPAIQTPITLYPTLPLIIIIIFDMVLRQKRNIQQEN